MTADPVQPTVCGIRTSAYAALTGHKPRMLIAGKTTLRLMGLFNPLTREMVEMNYLQTSPLALDDSALRGLLGEIKKTPYDDGSWQCGEAAQRSR